MDVKKVQQKLKQVRQELKALGLEKIEESESYYKKLELFCKRLELGRGIWHSSTIAPLALLYYYCVTWQKVVLLVLGVAFLIAEHGRQYFPSWQRAAVHVFGKLMRPKELEGLSGLAYFAWAAVIIILCNLFLGLKSESMLCGLMFLAVGDPMARIFGKAVGGVRFPKTNKTLVGGMAFFTFGFLASILACTFVGVKVSFFAVQSHIPQISFWGLVFAGLCAMIIEVYSKERDNFHIPLWTTMILWGLRYAV